MNQHVKNLPDPRVGIKTVVWILLVISAVACGLAWFGSVMFANLRIDQLIQREQEQAQSEAEHASANLDLRLAQARNIPLMAAQDPAIQSALARFGPDAQASGLPLEQRGERWRADAELKPIAQRLAQLVEKFNLTTLWVTNAAADTVAEGHSSEVRPFTGANYADRAYFKAAQQGQNGRQFVVGRVTNVYGLFFSSPVQVNGQFVGMVGAGLAVSKLGSVTERANVVVVDDLGVIVLSRDPELLMQTMPGATVNTLSTQERDLRYKRQDFQAANLQPAPGIGPLPVYRWRHLERPHVMGSHTTSDGALRVYVLQDLGESFSNSQRDQLWWFGLVSILVVLAATLAGGVAQYLMTAQQQRADLQNLNQALTREANTDALTGCANRRHFLHALEQEHTRARRYGYDTCLLSLDIDYFKRVNDTYGHAGGDEVLKHFVATLQSKLRDSDLLGRVGGEEFSVLLPQTPAEGGAMMAERIRASVEASPALFGNTPIAVTVSIGGVRLPPDDTHSVDAVLACADEALYAAKHGGRNRVQWAGLPDNA